jgi:hypothetical protein
LLVRSEDRGALSAENVNDLVFPDMGVHRDPVRRKPLLATIIEV